MEIPIGLKDLKLGTKSPGALLSPLVRLPPTDLPGFALRLITLNDQPLGELKLKLKMIGNNPPAPEIYLINHPQSEILYQEKLPILGYADHYEWRIKTIPGRLGIVHVQCGEALSNIIVFKAGI